MSPDELAEAGRRLYGYGWQTRLAEDLGVNGSTVRRWVSGAVPIPGPVEAAIRCFLKVIPPRLSNPDK
jgi:DNA-binding transcriptional regulator YdaS (Cro superfamily)